MSTYCERAGLALQTIRFSFDGTRINESDTPKGLDMEDGDTIEVFQQPPLCCWKTSMVSPSSMSSPFGVSLSFIRVPSKEKRIVCRANPALSQ